MSSQPTRNIERLKTASHTVVDGPNIDQVTTDDLLGDYPAVEYRPPNGTCHIDILTRPGEAYAFAGLTVDRVAFNDIMVSVVAPRTLYEMKKDTVRFKDKVDAAMLKRRFGPED